MDGCAVLREIRTLDPKALVIMLTGFGSEEREWQALELGAIEFVPKGLSLHFLESALDRVLTRIGNTMKGDERRLFQRFLVQFPISLLQDGVKIGGGTCRELSVAGCTIESQANVRTNDHVALELYLPDREAETTPLRVEVAVAHWTILQKLRLEFFSLTDEAQQRLREYVKTLQTTSTR